MFDYERIEFVLQEMDALQEFAAVIQFDHEGSGNESRLRGSKVNKRRPDEVITI